MKLITIALTFLFLVGIISTSYAERTTGVVSAVHGITAQDVIEGSIEKLRSGARWTVDSVRQVGDYIHMALVSAADSARVTMKISAEKVDRFLNLSGQPVNVIPTEGGDIIEVSGQAVAFVPNEQGHNILRSEKLK